MADPGQHDDELYTHIIVDGIDFNRVLKTIPRILRQDAAEYLETNGVIDTISSKIIPSWDDNTQSEALRQVLGDKVGIYAIILINMFKVRNISSARETTRDSL